MDKTPTERGSICQISKSEYARRARELDRNFSVVETSPNSVTLRLDFPGTGLADGFSPEFLSQARSYFDAVFPAQRAQPTWRMIATMGVLTLVLIFLTAAPAGLVRLQWISIAFAVISAALWVLSAQVPLHIEYNSKEPFVLELKVLQARVEQQKNDSAIKTAFTGQSRLSAAAAICALISACAQLAPLFIAK